MVYEDLYFFCLFAIWYGDDRAGGRPSAFVDRRNSRCVVIRGVSLTELPTAAERHTLGFAFSGVYVNNTCMKRHAARLPAPPETRSRTSSMVPRCLAVYPFLRSPTSLQLCRLLLRRRLVLLLVSAGIGLGALPPRLLDDISVEILVELGNY